MEQSVVGHNILTAEICDLNLKSADCLRTPDRKGKLYKGGWEVAEAD